MPKQPHLLRNRLLLRLEWQSTKHFYSSQKMLRHYFWTISVLGVAIYSLKAWGIKSLKLFCNKRKGFHRQHVLADLNRAQHCFISRRRFPSDVVRRLKHRLNLSALTKIVETCQIWNSFEFESQSKSSKVLNENLGSEALTGCETGHTCHIVTLMKPVIRRQALSFIFIKQAFWTAKFISLQP